MRGIHKRQEPTDMQHVRANMTIYQIFENARCHVFLTKLCGYDDFVAFDFVMDFSSASNSIEVRGLSFSVTPQVIVEVTGLLETREAYFPSTMNRPSNFNYILSGF